LSVNFCSEDIARVALTKYLFACFLLAMLPAVALAEPNNIPKLDRAGESNASAAPGFPIRRPHLHGALV
jgi:hypothetical protein